MLVFKKIVAAIFMILSVIAIIVLIVSLFGSWAVKGRLETTSIDLLLAGENVVEVTRERLAHVDEILHTSAGVVDNVDTRVKEFGTGIKESDLLMTRLVDTIGIDLTSGIESAVSTFRQIEANVIAINDAVDAITAIPLLGIENRLPSVTKLQEVEDQLTKLQDDVARLVQLVRDGRAEIIDGKIGKVTDITGGLRDSLHTTRADLNEADLRLAESAETMADLRERIPGLYTAITIVLNLLFLLGILAFISLFLHSWEYFKCPEDGLSGLMPGDCDKVPVAA